MSVCITKQPHTCKQPKHKHVPAHMKQTSAQLNMDLSGWAAWAVRRWNLAPCFLHRSYPKLVTFWPVHIKAYRPSRAFLQGNHPLDRGWLRRRSGLAETMFTSFTGVSSLYEGLSRNQYINWYTPMYIYCVFVVFIYVLDALTCVFDIFRYVSTAHIGAQAMEPRICIVFELCTTWNLGLSPR